MNQHDPRVGDTLAFTPSVFMRPTEERSAAQIALTLPGRVIYVNAEHHYYTVEAPCWGYTLRESYKF